MYSIVTTLPLGALVLHNTSPETQSLSLTYCGLLVRKSRKSSTGQALSPESGSGWSWCGIQIARSCRFFDKSNVYSSDVWHTASWYCGAAEMPRSTHLVPGFVCLVPASTDVTSLRISYFFGENPSRLPFDWKKKQKSAEGYVLHRIIPTKSIKHHLRNSAAPPSAMRSCSRRLFIAHCRAFPAYDRFGSFSRIPTLLGHQAAERHG